MFRLLIFLLFWGLVFANPAWAADGSERAAWDKRFVLHGGAMFIDAKGDFSSTRTGRPVIEVDLKDLGLDEYETSYFVGSTIRLSERWHLRLDYYGYHEDAVKRSQIDFEFGDLVVPVGALTDSSIDLDLYVANLSYSFYKTDRARFGLGLGVHAADLSLIISAEAGANGTTVDLGSAEEDFIAPVPNIYASGLYALNDKLYFHYGGGWMSMSYEDISGDLLFGRAMLEYWPQKNIGIGVGYSYLAADIDYERTDRKETYDIDLPGPVAYLAVGF